MEIKHIVFDIGNVLIGWDQELAFLEQIPDIGERQWFLENICTGAWNLEQDRGRGWREAEELLIESHPEQADNIRAYRRNWPMMVTGAISESVDILRSVIDTGYDVTMLTNFASDTLALVRAEYDFLNISRGVTVSAEIGMIKPDAEIFHHHVNQFDLSPAHSVFIDDSEKNVLGAKQAGWQAIHFQDGEMLRADLQKLGVNV